MDRPPPASKASAAGSLRSRFASCRAGAGYRVTQEALSASMGGHRRGSSAVGAAASRRCGAERCLRPRTTRRGAVLHAARTRAGGASEADQAPQVDGHRLPLRFNVPALTHRPRCGMGDECAGARPAYGGGVAVADAVGQDYRRGASAAAAMAAAPDGASSGTHGERGDRAGGGWWGLGRRGRDEGAASRAATPTSSSRGRCTALRREAATSPACGSRVPVPRDAAQAAATRPWKPWKCWTTLSPSARAREAQPHPTPTAPAHRKKPGVGRACRTKPRRAPSTAEAPTASSLPALRTAGRRRCGNGGTAGPPWRGRSAHGSRIARRAAVNARCARATPEPRFTRRRPRSPAPAPPAP